MARRNGKAYRVLNSLEEQELTVRVLQKNTGRFMAVLAVLIHPPTYGGINDKRATIAVAAGSAGVYLAILSLRVMGNAFRPASQAVRMNVVVLRWLKTQLHCCS